jgi:hypothetical protein
LLSQKFHRVLNIHSAFLLLLACVELVTDTPFGKSISSAACTGEAIDEAGSVLEARGKRWNLGGYWGGGAVLLMALLPCNTPAMSGGG